MGGIDPLSALALQTGVGLISGNRQAKAQNAAARAAANFQAQQIRRAQEIKDRQRRDLLRRNLATQRARFASQGIGRGGSANALLKGLSKETDQAVLDDRLANGIRIDGINNAFAKTRRRNLLELSGARQRVVFNLLGKGLSSFSLFDR